MATRDLPALNRVQVTSMIGDGVAALVTRAFAAYDRTPDTCAIAEFAADYSAHATVESRLFPDVLPVLTVLAQQGWRMACCTNKPERAARTLLQAVGVLPLLSAVGGGDSFPVRKPDPGHLLATLALAGGTPQTTLMLGDHHNDVLAARAAGMPCIFAAWGYGAPGMSEGAAAIANNITEAAAIANRLRPTPVTSA
jgi:phosphoglycolate phosphatase